VGVAVAALPVAPASGAVPAPGIAIHDAGSGTELVKFLQVHCRYSAVRRGAVLDRDFTLRPSYARGWRLVGQVGAFTGYRRYTIPRTDQGGDDNWFSLRAPDGTVYNNVAKPAGAMIPNTGWFTFPSGRLTIGLGFINAWSLNLQRAVTIAGVAKCLYPPRRIP
jgi:hypothetical protein